MSKVAYWEDLLEGVLRADNGGELAAIAAGYCAGRIAAAKTKRDIK